MDEQNLVYLLDGKLYINLTNACTNQCLFCIRNLKDDVKGKSLWLNNENVKSSDVIEQFNDIYNGETDVIFCGYGEPTLKLEGNIGGKVKKIGGNKLQFEIKQLHQIAIGECVMVNAYNMKCKKLLLVANPEYFEGKNNEEDVQKLLDEHKRP